ncbi:MAG: hypothetical protein ACYCQJ_15220 [Nitrososphaerales archaeon]
MANLEHYLKQLESKTSSEISSIPTDFTEFNLEIGLPVHPVTNLPTALLPYQVQIGEYLHDNVLVNKSNKIGVTEAILRKYAYRGVIGDCQGYQMMIGAQERELAIENLSRLAQMFENSYKLRNLVKESKATRLKLKNGTVYFVMPRNSNAMRGWPRLKAAFLDEASHYGLLEDEQIITATSARLANTNGYLDIVSTPHGQRGFFYRLCVQADAGKIPFRYFRLPYTVALGQLISQDKIDRDRATMRPDEFRGEYECEFIASGNAAIESEIVDLAVGDYDL